MSGAHARPCVVSLGATGSASASVPHPHHDGAPKSPQHWQSQCHPAWAAQGGQSHFRGEDAYGKGNAVRAAKIGTVPCERLRSTASAAYEPAVGGNPAANASTRAIIS